MDMGSGSQMPSGGRLGGTTPGGMGAPPSAPNFPGSPAPVGQMPQGGETGSGQLTAQSNGVVGLRDLQLQPDSMLASKGKEVRLEAGSQMLLRVQSQ